MSDKELAQIADSLVDKGVTSDIGDTDYLYNATREEIDKVYDLMEEHQAYGYIAYRKKYLTDENSTIS